MTMADTSLRDIVAPHVFAQADALRTGFTTARPFSHCVIDGFFATPHAQGCWFIELHARMPGMVGSGAACGR